MNPNKMTIEALRELVQQQTEQIARLQKIWQDVEIQLMLQSENARRNLLNQQVEESYAKLLKQWADTDDDNKRLKNSNQRWRELLFKTAEKYVRDSLNADGDVAIELLEQALAAPQKGQDNERTD